MTVNEQNPLAVGFYEHIGVNTYKRTDTDKEGDHYPLLFMINKQQTEITDLINP